MSTPKKQQHPDLSIVIPALNEEKRIGQTLELLAKLLKEDPFLRTKRVEVIVSAADGGDRTQEVVKTKEALFAEFQLLSPGPRLGKGRDVRYGMLHANGEAVLFMDADLSTPLKHVAQFLKAFEDGEAEIIIGTRDLRTHHKDFARRFVANGGNFLFRVVGGLWVEDSQCGFKLFSRRANKLCFEKMTILGWGFDMEILAIARDNRISVKTYRIDDWIEMPEGNFDGQTLKNAMRSLGELAYIAGNRIRGVYKQK